MRQRAPTIAIQSNGDGSVRLAPAQPYECDGRHTRSVAKWRFMVSRKAATGDTAGVRWGEGGLRLNGGLTSADDPTQPSKRSPANANDLYLDAAISEDSGRSVSAESGRPEEFEPAKAIASIATAMIKATTAFALSQ